MIRDALGRILRIDGTPRRIVSLVPSITETLFDLGAGEQVVGITDFCIFPAGLQLPRLGGTKNPNIDRIRALKPDLVHMNLEENLKRHADAIESFAPVFVSEPKNVADVEALIESLGQIHDCAGAASAAVAAIRATRAGLPRETFTFACAIWKQPWMWCGGDTYISSLVTTAGGRNVLERSTRYPSLTIEVVAASAPQVIFLPDEPYFFTADDAAIVGSATGAHVVGPFPGHLFTWHGTRTIKGLEFLRDTFPH